MNFILNIHDLLDVISCRIVYSCWRYRLLDSRVPEDKLFRKVNSYFTDLHVVTFHKISASSSSALINLNRANFKLFWNKKISLIRLKWNFCTICCQYWRVRQQQHSQKLPFKSVFIQSFRPFDWQFSVLCWLYSSLNIFNTLTLDREFEFRVTYLNSELHIWIQSYIFEYCPSDDITIIESMRMSREICVTC
jgi:hypothetical protein